MLSELAYQAPEIVLFFGLGFIYLITMMVFIITKVGNVDLGSIPLDSLLNSEDFGKKAANIIVMSFLLLPVFITVFKDIMGWLWTIQIIFSFIAVILAIFVSFYFTHCAYHHQLRRKKGLR